MGFFENWFQKPPKKTSDALMVRSVDDKQTPSGANRAYRPWLKASLAVGAVITLGVGAGWALTESEVQNLKLSDLIPEWPELDETSGDSASAPGTETPKPQPVTPETPKVAPKPEPVPQPTPEPAPTPKAPVVEKPRFVSADTYQLSELNLGGVDTNGDGVLDGPFTRLSEAPIESPTNTQTYTLQERLSREDGVELSERECAEAIRAGGFEKDGKTYELWVSKTDPNVIEIVPVNAGHDLVGDVPKFDSVEGAEVPTQAEVQQDADETFGWKDRCGNIVPGSGTAGLKMRLEDVGLENDSDYRDGPNPFHPRDWRYTVWQEIHMFMNRNKI